MGDQRDDFAKCISDTFRVVGDRAIDWRLVNVSELPRSGEFERYSIVFETSEPDAAQGIVTLEHTERGATDLFVVALGPGRSAAVVNQLVGASQ